MADYTTAASGPALSDILATTLGMQLPDLFAVLARRSVASHAQELGAVREDHLVAHAAAEDAKAAVGAMELLLDEAARKEVAARQVRSLHRT
jgi:hypothetical protein